MTLGLPEPAPCNLEPATAVSPPTRAIVRKVDEILGFGSPEEVEAQRGKDEFHASHVCKSQGLRALCSCELHGFSCILCAWDLTPNVYSPPLEQVMAPAQALVRC